MKDKLTIAWICPLEFTRFRDRLNFHAEAMEVIAPWMTLLTEIFERHRAEAELHVISAPPRLAKDAHIIENGINYYFISGQIPIVGGKMPFLLKKLISYRTIRRKVKKILYGIVPDIVEFHGAEHDLSWSFFDVKYPKMLNPQFFVNNYYTFRPTEYLRYWVKIEQKIYASCKNFSYRNEHMKREILALNPQARLFRYQYPIKRPLVKAEEYPEKDAEIVFTARLIKSKGIEDLLHVLKVIKTEIPGVKAKIIGQCSPEYMTALEDLSRSLGIRANLAFLGFLPTQEAMFEEVAKSSLSILPTHFDLIPGSVLEAMFIGTPVVAYAAGGLPELNQETETVRLVSIGNIEILAKEIIALLNDKKQRDSLAGKARNYVIKNFDNEQIFGDMISAYRTVVRLHNNLN